MNELVQINKKNKDETNVSRRNFLKLVGTTAALGATGCADKADQKIFPYLHGQNETIPGVATWFSSTCTECSAGCGITVKTREGRAIKIEGNKNHPINRGSLCALGQAALQNLYDPDRVREPLKKVKNKDGSTSLKPTKWESQLKRIAKLLPKSKGNSALITGEVSGALADLIKEWTDRFGIQHIVYDPLSQTELAEASELVYGVYGIPEYRFDKADVVLNFGADFLETWISPTQYARGWSEKKRSGHPALNIHVEPRLSLTGANADMWLNAKPGTEIKIAMAIMKVLVESNTGSDNLNSSIVSRIRNITKDLTLDEVANESGVKKGKTITGCQAASRGEAFISYRWRKYCFYCKC